jgi:excinuclease ABC subunit B
MATAIDETNRRRAKQVAHNELHGIDPTPLRKKLGDILDDIYREADDTDTLVGERSLIGERNVGSGRQVTRGKSPVPAGRTKSRSIAVPTAGMARAELAQLIADLTEQMLGAARELQFELAARIRDEISEMKKELRQMDLSSR